MAMLELKEIVGGLVTANGVRWYEQVLRRDNHGVLKITSDFEVCCKRKRGRLKKTLKKQIKEETEKIGF